MSPGKKKKTTPNPTLAAACGRNLPLDMQIEGDKSATGYRSRFLGLEERTKEFVLVIEAPAPKGSVVPIRPGQRVKVSFRLNDQENYFEADVLDRGRYQLNQEVAVASLELQMPEEVVRDGKRGFYRLLKDRAEAMEVRLGILADDEAGDGRIRWREKAIVTDIGGGGLGFRISEGKSLFLRPDTWLYLRFRLRPEDEEIELLGRICFSLRQPELREAFFGVQFIELDSDIKYKQHVDRILHYVAEEQRRNLGERSG
jgi:c-di-GMP-binding flagellar brake protein YcgR